jgi:hypothetical protein
MKRAMPYLFLIPLVCVVSDADGALNRSARVTHAGLSGICLYQSAIEGSVPEPFLELTISIYEGNSDRVVAKTIPDTNGRFQLTLPPGRYRVVPKPLTPDVPGQMPHPCPTPTEVEVVLGKATVTLLVAHGWSQTACD